MCCVIVSDPQIFIAYKKDTFEIKALKATASERNLPIVFGKVDDTIQLVPASVLFWRGGNFMSEPLHARDRFLHLQAATTMIINHRAYQQAGVFGKSIQHAIMFENDRFFPATLKRIPTITAETVENLHDKIVQHNLAFPLIAKPEYGARGEGIVLLDSLADLRHLWDKLSEYVFQPYIPNQGDYRVLVIGGVVHDCIKRQASPAAKNTHLNNLSQGGVAERVPEGELRQRLIKYATKIASCFNATFCGVDLLEAETGDLYFLEINFNPQWQGLQRCSPHNVASHLLDSLVDLHNRIQAPPTLSSIQAYYERVAPFLAQSARIHYYSRMYLWTGNETYRNVIDSDAEAWWSTVASDLQKINDPATQANAALAGKLYRVAAKLQHPRIDEYNALFFKVLFDRTVFSGRHYRQELDTLDLATLRDVHQKLLGDPVSLFTLSTLAVNFLYLCDYFFGDEDQLFRVDPKRLLAIAQIESLAKRDNDRDARIYFYTHAIIGASAFYSRPIAPEYISFYREMLQEVERILIADFVHASLDHKCEFAVCAKIMGYESVLYQTILTEVLASFSEHGNYITNALNTYARKPTINNADGMEHTNVLAIMAFLADYRFAPAVK